MSRNPAGVYTLPNGEVIADTTILALDENTTRNDMAVELTNSLDRYGRGGMLAPLRVADGTSVVPGLGFTNDTDSGFWRQGENLWHLVAGGVAKLSITADSVKANANFIMEPLKALYLDGGSDTYIQGNTTDNIVFVCGGTGKLTIGPAGSVFNGNISLQPGSVLSLDGGGDTYIQENVANSIAMVAGGATRATFAATGNTVFQSLGGISIPSGAGLFLDGGGGGDTYIVENPANTIVFAAGGNARASVVPGGVNMNGAINIAGTSATAISNATAGQTVLTLTHSSANPNGMFLNFTAGAPNNAVNYFAAFADTSGFKAIIQSNGGLHNFSANNVNLCDGDVKTFADEMPDVRKKFRGLMIRMGRYDDEPLHPMLTAQQVKEVFPELVVPWAPDSDLLGVREHAIQMYHLHVTQQHDDELAWLKQRVADLEGRLPQ